MVKRRILIKIWGIILGIQINQCKDGVYVYQTKYTKELLTLGLVQPPSHHPHPHNLIWMMFLLTEYIETSIKACPHHHQPKLRKSLIMIPLCQCNKGELMFAKIYLLKSFATTHD